EWGMGEKLYYEPDQKDAEIEINRLLENADRQAHEIILAEKENTAKLARALLERETLTREEVLELLNLETLVEASTASSAAEDGKGGNAWARIIPFATNG